MLRMVSYPHRSQSGHITCYLNRTYHVLPTSHWQPLAPCPREAHTLAERGAPMHRMALLIMVALLSAGVGHSSPPADSAINATAIEACSCPHFCMCYFNAHPAAHHENGKTEHYCKFNNAYKVNKGHYGPTDLTGTKFWLSGDLGGDFSQGQMDWAL